MTTITGTSLVVPRTWRRQADAVTLSRVSFFSRPPASISSAPRHGLLRIACSASSSTTGEGSKSTADVLSPEAFLGHDYFQILGITVDTPPAEIRKAYWRLQKKYHPDIVGEEGHGMALLLNEAYNTLMNDRRREVYENQWRSAASLGYVGFTGQPRSEWNGPDWPQGIFVDESTCVGCQECAFQAPNTFDFDTSVSKARVKVQWGDHESKIKAATESCPVSCIHAVPREDLAALEFLMQPRQKEGRGALGGSWEMPARGNIFLAAQNLKRKIAQQEKEMGRRGRAAERENETPAQRRARMAADWQTQKENNPFWWLWSLGGLRGPSAAPADAQHEPQASAGSYTSGWGEGSTATTGFWQGGSGAPEEGRRVAEFPWQRMFGQSGAAELRKYRVAEADVERVVVFIQEWASLWACSSEIPLPMPFRADPLPSGVQLTMLTTGASGALASIGSLLITVEHQPSTLSTARRSTGPLESISLSALEGREGAGDLEGGREKEVATGGGEGGRGEAGRGIWVLKIVRQGVEGKEKALPGEGRILRHLGDALARRDNAKGYEAYHLPRNNKIPVSL
eukprot:TRINITY_DN1709_c0_g1_i1.p1 TRINITY_DN1709_c0_g1~~TRINITY_DN1709_c0_g1_i1.p1  ORF type:complete len:570 (+),score=113.06 TRINITY_DN1709_c0_g1_i1:134-1843(+)